MRRSHSILERSLWLGIWGAILFFGRFATQGLQPDAALYSGLSLKVLRSGEAWALSGTGDRFAQFFEHPPYFYQWGAWVLKNFGVNDGAARAIGGIPGFAGLLLLLFWLWRRRGWATTMVAALIAATFVHYTKFASTAMLEGPLSLGVLLVAIGAFEGYWQIRHSWRRPLLSLVTAAGLIIATASKGVMGLGAWGGLSASLFLAFLFSRRRAAKLFLSTFTLGFWFAVSLSPLLYWAYKMFFKSAFAWIEGYVVQQVFRSATTNRGEVTHLLSGDRLYYLKILFTEAFPWAPLALGAMLVIFLSPLLEKRLPYFFKFKSEWAWAWSWVCVAFGLAFLLPLSFVRFQLPHYAHPLYLLLIPLAAFAVVAVAPVGLIEKLSESPLKRWALLLIVGTGWVAAAPRISHSPNRGQEFIAVADRVKALDPRCQVLVSREKMESYRMEAFSLWYWQGRSFLITDREVPARIALPPLKVYWDPTQNVLWGNDLCRI